MSISRLIKGTIDGCSSRSNRTQGPARAPGLHLARNLRDSLVRAGRHAALARRLGVPRPHGGDERLGARAGSAPRPRASRRAPAAAHPARAAATPTSCSWPPSCRSGLAGTCSWRSTSGSAGSSVPPALNVVGFVRLPRHLALLAGTEGEQLRRAGGEAAEGTRAQSGDHRPLRLCAPSHVCERDPDRGRRPAHARVVVGPIAVAASGVDARCSAP